jgi:hypothetical protein
MSICAVILEILVIALTVLSVFSSIYYGLVYTQYIPAFGCVLTAFRLRVGSIK